ncbi:Rha family transcriptional regulator [Advenella sp. WQ 585]|uniref:Rha family transcriptional regulator n=1 Tax=Advenella mandrilli TaxID=2800330 RepID=A0ABS1EF32_9BURK|nr:Rha family transcriptional regulator [Advenella mandrilli]MBK1780582.1 Rha family transcriptional regulator [Advenella mandrilli]
MLTQTNNLMQALSVNTTITMTSLEIADLVESRHDNVRIAIQRLVDKGVITLPAMQEKPTAGRPTQVYVFSGEQGKRDSIIVVAQLSPEFTARLVDRWQELEQGVAAIPRSLPEALRLAADLAEKNEHLAIERDHAVATKAQIGSKREATAMATASKHKREAEKLKHELGRNRHHATIIAVERATGLKFPKNAYVALRKWCKKNNTPSVDVVDDRYGSVKAWPAGAWLSEYDVDLSELFVSEAA